MAGCVDGAILEEEEEEHVTVKVICRQQYNYCYHSLPSKDIHALIVNETDLGYVKYVIIIGLS